MSNIVQYAQPTRLLRLDQTYDQLNGGTINIYSGAIPADADAALGGAVLLATLTFGTPAFNAAVAPGTKTAKPITSGLGLANGVATFFRAITSGAVVVNQGTVGVTGSGEAMEIVNTTIVIGVTVSCSSATFSEPA